MSDTAGYAQQLQRLAPLMIDFTKQFDVEWDEMLCWRSMPNEGQTSFHYTYRHGRELNYCRSQVGPDAMDELNDGMKISLQEIRLAQGRAPRMALLRLAKDGTASLFCDFENADALRIEAHDVGMEGAYFTLAQIDLPDFVLAARAAARQREKELEGMPVLELRFLYSDFGEPGPDELADVEKAIVAAMGAGKRAIIVSSAYEDIAGGGMHAILSVAVADLEEGAARIARLLYEIHAPKGTTLSQKTPAVRDFALDLKDKKTLMLEVASGLTNRLVSESVRCAPADWKQGTLTIGCDGARVDYKLKNEHATSRAVISPALMQLCEDFAVLMWKNDQKWSEAELSFVRANGEVDFKTTFNYGARKPEAPAEPARRPWWRLW